MRVTVVAPMVQVCICILLALMLSVPASSHRIEPIECTVRCRHDRQEPWPAIIERRTGKDRLVEDADRLRGFDDLSSDLVAKVIHHRHAVAVAACDVVQPVLSADMGDAVEAEGDLAA